MVLILWVIDFSITETSLGFNLLLCQAREQENMPMATETKTIQQKQPFNKIFFFFLLPIFIQK